MRVLFHLYLRKGLYCLQIRPTRWRLVIDPMCENRLNNPCIVLLIEPRQHQSNCLRFYNLLAWYREIAFKKIANSFVIRVPCATSSQLRQTNAPVV